MTYHTYHSNIGIRFYNVQDHLRVIFLIDQKNCPDVQKYLHPIQNDEEILGKGE